MALIANVNRDGKKHPKPYYPWDMLPMFMDKPTPSPMDLVAKISMAFGRPFDPETEQLVPTEYDA